MRRSEIYLLAVLIAVIIILFGYQYLFSIYEVEISVEPGALYADNKSVCLIKTIPLNSFGVKAPLRKASAAFEIKEGRDLIEITELDEINGILKIKATEKTGTVIIYIKPEKAILPSSVEIKIFPNTA